MQRSLLGFGTAPLRSIWAAYERQLQRRPVLTQMTTSAVLWGVGDVIAQGIERSVAPTALTTAAAAGLTGPKSASLSATQQQRQQQQQQQQEQQQHGALQHLGGVDWRRVALTAAFGATLVGSIGHFWYIGIDQFCARYFAKNTAAFIAAKVTLDTVIMGPFYVASFFAFGCAFIDGGGMAEFKKKMRTDFWPTLIAEVSIWPVVQAFNFAKVPLKHQLLVVNGMTTLDAAFMSWARNREDWLGKLLEELKGSSEKKAAAADKASKQRW